MSPFSLLRPVYTESEETRRLLPTSQPPQTSTSSQSLRTTITMSSDSKPSEEPPKQRGLFARLGFKMDAKLLYDAILGLSDGLTVPFALTAGLSSLGTTRIVILGGLAELVAGAISMGLGGFIGAQSEYESYLADERKCSELIRNDEYTVMVIIMKHFQAYGLAEEDVTKILNQIYFSDTQLKDFLMKHHFCSEKPDTGRPYTSAVTLGLSYFLGGFVALIPYFCVAKNDVKIALYWSIGIMTVVMLAFGYGKTCVVRGWKGKGNITAGVIGAGQMLLTGGLAVGAAYGLVKAIETGSIFK